MRRLPLPLLALLALSACNDPAGLPSAPRLHPAIVDLQAGAGTSCALIEDGSLWCWGLNPGEFQNGDPTPVRIAIPGPVTSFALARGGYSLCATDSAGAAWCQGYWFRIDQGASYGAVPTILEDTLPLGGLSTYFGHACGLMLNGEAVCWGSNLFGKRGQGIPDTLSLGDATPNRVAGGNQFRSITAGGDHTCGIRVDGTLACWGLESLVGSDWAQVLTGAACFYDDLTCVWTPAILALSQVEQVSAGAIHTCARAGAVWCWGGFGGTPLGDGTGLPHLRPHQVQLPESAIDITAGGRHSCAVGRSGRAYCWGVGPETGHHGTLGRPAAVETDLRFTRLSAGSSHTCGVAEDQAVYCWGSSYEGELGTADTAASYVPLEVPRPWESN
ncbi:MAG: hypothetical protein JNM53_04165 [Gemmatimonadetes bacterium]|nr:hypothetical protein [Gemmatimonadota bacterium]